jgi:chromosome segregation ATPase
LETVVTDAIALQRELDVKVQQVIGLETSHNQLIEDSKGMQRKHFDEISEFERIIDERNREIRDLTLKYNIIKTDSEQEIQGLRKNILQHQKHFKSKTAKWRRAISLLRQQKKNIEEKLVNRIKVRERQIEEGNKLRDELKQRLDGVNEELRAKMQENRGICEKLSNSLTETQRKRKRMATQISNLQAAKVSLEMQIQSLNDQIRREAQIVNSQMAVRKMNLETQFQEELNSMISRSAREKIGLMTSVLAAFDVIEQFDGEDITEDVFLRTIEKIARNKTVM